MENDVKVLRITKPRNWKKIVASLCVGLAVFLGISYGTLDFFFPYRTQTISAGALKIPPSVRNYIDGIVTKNDNIIGVQVVTIDFVRNIRIETFMSISNPAVQEIYNRFVNNKVLETPVFLQDKSDNERILRMINGEFVCVPYKQATAYKYAPQAEAFISHVCSIAIPPQHFGEFAGILTIYLKDNPTKEETEELFLFAREISIKIAEANHKNEIRK